MPYNANFSVTQSIDCATITITDTSSNPSGEVITGRKLYLQKADGTYIAPSGQDYYDFSPILFPSNAITIPLSQDFALAIRMAVTPATVVSGSVYSVVNDYSFACNLESFRLARISDMASVPSIVNDENFRGSLYNLSLEIDNAGLAIGVGDIQSSQAAIDRGYNLVNNQNLYF